MQQQQTAQTMMATAPAQQMHQQMQTAAPLLANPAPRAGTPMADGTPTLTSSGGCMADAYPMSAPAPFISPAYYQIPYANGQQTAHYYQSPYGGVMLSQGTSPPAAMTPPPSSIMYMPVQYAPSGGMHFIGTPPATLTYHDQQAFEQAHDQAPASLTPSPDTVVGQTHIPEHTSPCDNPKASLCLEGSTVFKNRQNGAVPMWNYCQFCKNNGEPEEFFRSHILRNPSDGKVVCPVLRVYSCPVCNNGGGDYAHTKSYCPQLAKNNINRFHANQRRHFGLNKAPIGGY